VNRRFSALILSGLGAGALYAATLSPAAPTEQAADPAAVDRYLAQLSEEVPPPVAAKLAKETPPPSSDSERTKALAKADRAEPVAAAAFTVIR
jgi:hypothetical protein